MSLDLDRFAVQYQLLQSEGTYNLGELEDSIRQNDKLLIAANDESVKYTNQRANLVNSFESIFRSLGVTAGVLVGGPVGSATLGAVSGGVGRGIGQFFGNRVYGDTIEQLENFTENYKFKQLINYYTRSQLSATRDLNDEFYSQTQQEISQTLNQIAQQ